MDYRDTPIYIISFNRLELGLKDLVTWLLNAEMHDITIIDNNSTYEPLMNYYYWIPWNFAEVKLVRLPENYGHEAAWRMGIHKSVETRFIVTDPDVIPSSSCPLDLVRKMHEVTDRYPGGAKVGPGIRIDNLPDEYRLKDLMLRSEKGYWDESRRTPEGDGFFSAIDTTFALYEPGWGRWPEAPHVRLDFPYVVEHRPWYVDSSQPHAERDYYAQTVIPGISHSQ
jgi:GT2 family glycosyltransferase